MYKVISFSFLATVFTVLFTFVAGVIIARLLGPEPRGDLGFLLMFANIAWALCTFGLNDAYIYFKRKRNEDGFFLALMLVVLFVCVLNSVLFGLFLYGFFDFEYIAIDFLLILFVSFSGFYLSLHFLQVYSNLYLYNFFKVCNPLLLLVGVTVLLLFEIGGDLNNVLFVYVASYLVLSVLTLLIIVSKEIKLDNIVGVDDWAGVWGYSIKIYGFALIGVFLSNFDKIYFFIKGASYEFGLYVVAYSTSRLLTLIPHSLSTVIFSKYAGKDEEELVEVTRKSYSLIFLPLFVSVILLSLSSIVLLPIIFGEEYEGIVIPFIVLLVEAGLSSMCWILTQRFMASGKTGSILWLQSISVLPLVILMTLNTSIQLEIVVSMVMVISAFIRLEITRRVFNNMLKKNKLKVILNPFEYYAEVKGLFSKSAA